MSEPGVASLTRTSPLVFKVRYKWTQQSGSGTGSGLAQASVRSAAVGASDAAERRPGGGQGGPGGRGR